MLRRCRPADRSLRPKLSVGRRSCGESDRNEDGVAGARHAHRIHMPPVLRNAQSGHPHIRRGRQGAAPLGKDQQILAC